MRILINITSKIFRRLATYFERLSRSRDFHDQQVQKASSAHDMARYPDESYYAAQYLYWIRQVIYKAFLDKKVLALDLGCGQGRLTIPLADHCSKITGVDFTRLAVEVARDNAGQTKCRNANFIESDLLAYLETQGEETFDFVVFTEVVFFLPVYKKALSEIFRVLKSGGYAFISFRSQYFDILYSVRSRKWESALTALQQREGYLWGGQTWFSWQTEVDIRALLQQCGYNHLDCVGIGVCSGIKGDPLEMIARPSLLGPDDQKRLQEIEICLAKDYVNNGRYILAIAQK